MAKKKKPFPSQERYQAKNPTVSFRLSKAQKKKLDKIADREGKTPGQYVRDYLNGLVEEREKEDEIYDKGYDEGYQKGARDWLIQFYCDVCGQPIIIQPGSESHEELAEYLKSDGWGHPECHEKVKRRLK